MGRDQPMVRAALLRSTQRGSAWLFGTACTLWVQSARRKPSARGHGQVKELSPHSVLAFVQRFTLAKARPAVPCERSSLLLQKGKRQEGSTAVWLQLPGSGDVICSCTRRMLSSVQLCSARLSPAAQQGPAGSTAQRQQSHLVVRSPNVTAHG